MTREMLRAKVAAIVNQNPNVSVLVADDGTANCQQVMDALVLLQNADVKKVGLMSQSESQAQGAD